MGWKSCSWNVKSHPVQINMHQVLTSINAWQSYDFEFNLCFWNGWLEFHAYNLSTTIQKQFIFSPFFGGHCVLGIIQFMYISFWWQWGFDFMILKLIYGLHLQSFQHHNRQPHLSSKSRRTIEAIEAWGRWHCARRLRMSWRRFARTWSHSVMSSSVRSTHSVLLIWIQNLIDINKKCAFSNPQFVIKLFTWEKSCSVFYLVKRGQWWNQKELILDNFVNDWGSVFLPIQDHLMSSLTQVDGLHTLVEDAEKLESTYKDFIARANLK